MSERELAEYCRSKGVFVDDVKTWRALSIKDDNLLEKQRKRAIAITEIRTGGQKGQFEE
ncbi:hypothetical protein [Vibrio cidicii]|uniref:hypothetical protein n=1 Tax=Vibrio cidicii TaxID=1763883 RepID=UPI0018C2AD71|nr:hypothetical protein [Vibrio cidicii]